jgi:DNA-binding transcriptional regulator YiaG
LGQRELANAIGVPLETLRTWDSGRRSVPPEVLHSAAARLNNYRRQQELLPLAQLARELHVHVRTLQLAPAG